MGFPYSFRHDVVVNSLYVGKLKVPGLIPDHLWLDEEGAKFIALPTPDNVERSRRSRQTVHQLRLNSMFRPNRRVRILSFYPGRTSSPVDNSIRNTDQRLIFDSKDLGVRESSTKVGAELALEHLLAKFSLSHSPSSSFLSSRPKGWGRPSLGMPVGRAPAGAEHQFLRSCYLQPPGRAP